MVETFRQRWDSLINSRDISLRYLPFVPSLIFLPGYALESNDYMVLLRHDQCC